MQSLPRRCSRGSRELGRVQPRRQATSRRSLRTQGGRGTGFGQKRTRYSQKCPQSLSPQAWTCARARRRPCRPSARPSPTWSLPRRCSRGSRASARVQPRRRATSRRSLRTQGKRATGFGQRRRRCGRECPLSLSRLAMTCARVQYRQRMRRPKPTPTRRLSRRCSRGCRAWVHVQLRQAVTSPPSWRTQGRRAIGFARMQRWRRRV